MRVKSYGLFSCVTIDWKNAHVLGPKRCHALGTSLMRSLAGRQLVALLLMRPLLAASVSLLPLTPTLTLKGQARPLSLK